MISLLSKLLGLIPANVTKRLANKYTTHGSILLLFAAVQADMLPEGVIDAVQGVPNLEIWVLVTLGFILLFEKGGAKLIGKGISRFIPNKHEQLEDMKIETLILEEKLKQQNINKELENE